MEIQPVFTDRDKPSYATEIFLAKSVRFIKFVTVDPKKTIIGLGTSSHTRLIPADSPPPLGAGIIEQNTFKTPPPPPQAKWESLTVKQKYGLDRPRDPTEADKLLEEVRQAYIE